MSEVVEFSRWQHARVCITCEDGEACFCSDEDKGFQWVLQGTSGMIQRFREGGPFYGSWSTGRTGAMTDLDACKAAVEKAVWHG
jgi:hypothetical protein